MTQRALRIFILLIALILTNAALSQAIIGGDWRADVHNFARQTIDEGLAPGLGIAVVAGDRVVYSVGVGVTDINSGHAVNDGTYFYIASSTKALTATTIVQLAAEGVLDLDAPVTQYVPAIEFGAGLDADEVTIYDLLTMTEGIGDESPVVLRTAYSGEFTADQLIKLFANYPADEDGHAFDYSNVPYNILGLVLDAVDDGHIEPGGWKKVVHDTVLNPLGMYETTAIRSSIDSNRIAMPHLLNGEGRFQRSRLSKNDTNLHAAGGHFSSARSLARFVAAHVGEGKLEGRRIFSADAIRSTQTKHVGQDSAELEYQRDGWGYGWDHASWGDHLMLQRFGGFQGYFSHMSFLPEHQLGVVVLTNGSTRSPVADLVARYIYDRLLEHEDLETYYNSALEHAKNERDELARRITADLANRAQRLAPLPHPLAAYTGTFHNREMGTMHWQIIAGGLEVSMGVAHSRVEIFDAKRNRLRVTLTGSGTVVEFEFDEAGTARNLRWIGFDFQRQNP